MNNLILRNNKLIMLRSLNYALLQLRNSFRLLVLLSFVCERKMRNIIIYSFFIYFSFIFLFLVTNLGEQHRIMKNIYEEEFFPLEHT